MERFLALGCPCEVLLETANSVLAAEQFAVARQEAARIEKKYSRYLEGNILYRINHSRGHAVKVDEETAALLDYAAHCYDLSDGLFDITTGVLRQGLFLSRIGWEKIHWERPFITLPEGFEIDFGGIGKEYAADRILRLLRQGHEMSALVNLGGDIAASGDRLWSVGIEDATRPGEVARTVHLCQGAIATSGTTKRPGHIINPKTGRPVENAPQSVTVVDNTCTEAGFWTTLAILNGSQAESFLADQSLEYWCVRS